ncbi:hypothetical protein DFQ14_101468 [Halopolyspora algeriensis]|uniref:DUF6802 domain-containing protein n=1 Tax=Halopolyspora algeriensis TaxID=1500506 RepID=A0A368W1P5_9ACTN|nr:DUF6802 family protein [Halopolyspora algeriensis]RCW47124.1 hypothetical protein DFQ14_101468 [Halopolyspora algeriensis]TQM48211.1 hypothetical protein FHU43_3173 [Halopolyspora algeriensis]
MYVEDTGAGDGDIQITVEGAEYTAEANVDLDGDGIDDTVATMTDDGFVAYTDADVDGGADVVRTFGPEGTVLDQARYAQDRGLWISEQPQHPVAGRAGREPMVVDTPQGERRIGPATEDTDDDGRLDTTIVDTGGGRMLVTDIDGDGTADQAVEVDSTGEVTVAQHTGDGQWTVVEEGGIAREGGRAPDPAVSDTGDAAWESEEDIRPGGSQGTGPRQLRSLPWQGGEWWTGADRDTDAAWGWD